MPNYPTSKDWNAMLEQFRSLKDTHVQDYFRELLPLNAQSMEGKVVIVTGASSGIGESLARTFARHKLKVVLAARNEEKLQVLCEVLNRQGMDASYFRCDVQQREECEALVNFTVKQYGQIDILVNNAGISMRANFNDLKLEVLEEVMNTNFWGSVYCTKYALPYIRAKKGSVVGISSISGITPLPGRSGYVASKHALDGFLETLRLENKDADLHVMLVHPGFTRSNIRNVALNQQGEAQKETPRDEDAMMSSEEVANEVYKGIVYKRNNLILSMQGKLISWIYNTMPGLAYHLIYNEMKKEEGAPF